MMRFHKKKVAGLGKYGGAMHCAAIFSETRHMLDLFYIGIAARSMQQHYDKEDNEYHHPYQDKQSGAGVARSRIG